MAGFRLGATCFLFVGSADSTVTQGVILEICFVVMGNGGAAAVCRRYSAHLEQGGVGQLAAGAGPHVHLLLRNIVCLQPLSSVITNGYFSKLMNCFTDNV